MPILVHRLIGSHILNTLGIHILCLHWKGVESCGNHLFFLIVNRVLVNGLIWWPRILPILLRSLKHHVLHRDHILWIIIDRRLISKIHWLNRTTGSVVKIGGELFALVCDGTVNEWSIFVYIYKLTIFRDRSSLVRNLLIIQGLTDVVTGYLSAYLLLLIHSILRIWTLCYRIQPRFTNINVPRMQWINCTLAIYIWNYIWLINIARILTSDWIILVDDEALIRKNWHLSSRRHILLP